MSMKNNKNIVIGAAAALGVAAGGLLDSTAEQGVVVTNCASTENQVVVTKEELYHTADKSIIVGLSLAAGTKNSDVVALVSKYQSEIKSLSAKSAALAELNKKAASQLSVMADKVVNQQSAIDLYQNNLAALSAGVNQ